MSHPGIQTFYTLKHIYNIQEGTLLRGWYLWQPNINADGIYDNKMKT